MRLVFHLFLVWLVVYVIVTGALLAVRSFGLAIPLPVQTLFLTSGLVPFIMFGVGPFAARLSVRMFGDRMES